MEDAAWIPGRDPDLARFNGFENVVNTSVPVAGQLPVSRTLRDPVVSAPNPPILNGVTYVEHAPDVPNTINTVEAYIARAKAEIAVHRDPLWHAGQKEVVDRVYLQEMGVPRVNYLIPAKTSMIGIP